MAIYHRLIILGICLCISPKSVSSYSDPVINPKQIMIGAVLSSQESEDVFHQAVRDLNRELGALPQGVVFNATSLVMQENPIRAAQSTCSNLLSKQVYTVLASHPPSQELSPIAVSFTCGYYMIPVIGLSARESIFSDKGIHPFFMRTVPPFSEQAEIWVNLVRHFKWKSVIFLHTADHDGRAILAEFQNRMDYKNMKIEKTIALTPGLDSYMSELLDTDIIELTTRVILLYADREDGQNIIRDAVSLNLTQPGYAWIVTEQLLTLPDVPIGFLGASLVDWMEEEKHIRDSLQIIAKAFQSIYMNPKVSLIEAPTDCEAYPWVEEDETVLGGELVYDELIKQVLDYGQTGSIKFSKDGDRVQPLYNIVNIQENGPVVIGKTYVREIRRTKQLTVNMDNSSSIKWPPNIDDVPKGIKLETRLKVVTIAETPFVYTKPLSEMESCNVEDGRVLCPFKNQTTGNTTEMCCEGYCIDLLIQLALNISFTFDLHLVSDGQYGSYERINGSNTKTWNGMVQEVKEGKADLIMAPLTINPERADHIDFSKPFKYQGLRILVKKENTQSGLGSFLQPFKNTLWILVALSVHVVALVLYLLDRFSPFGRFKLAKSDDTEEDALNLSSALWFAWGVLLNSGIGEGTPRSFSARVVGMVWAGFAMIIVASYTANLAAFLVLDRPKASISGIDDARLRNPQDKYTYATVKNSAVSMYFKRQVELSTMYRTMEKRNYNNPEEAIQDVKDGVLSAFIWDSSRLEFEAEQYCDLLTAGEMFGRSGYAVGLPKDSPWTSDISLKILAFHEKGYMEELDGKWILFKGQDCEESNSAPATLGLTNMAGVFLMVAGGIVTGVLVIFVEIAYKRHRGMREKEMELARHAADRWRSNIEKRRTLRRTLLAQQQELEIIKPNGLTDIKVSPTSMRNPNTTNPEIVPVTSGSSSFHGNLPVVATVTRHNPTYQSGEAEDQL